jgi:hypothetical protein
MRTKELSNLEDCNYGVISFLDMAMVHFCLAWVPIKVLQVSVGKKKHETHVSMYYIGKNKKEI